MPPDAMEEEGKPEMITTQEVLHKSETSALKKLMLPSIVKASKENKETSVGYALRAPCNNPFKKRKQHEVDSVKNQVPEVIEIENTEILSQESDQSVDDKFVKPSFLKGRTKSEKLLKQGKCNNVESKKSSILNFFSRV